jgi:hypothetical protein
MPGFYAGHPRLEEFSNGKDVDGRDIQHEDAFRASARP